MYTIYYQTIELYDVKILAAKILGNIQKLLTQKTLNPRPFIIKKCTVSDENKFRPFLRHLLIVIVNYNGVCR